MPEPRNDRRAARAAGQRRVQTVTTWTAAGSVVAAGLLTAVLAHGTSAAATPTDQSTENVQNTGGTSGNDQLQAPQYLPGVSGGSRHGGSGGS